MMLVWGIGKEVAQKLQGSGFGFMTLIVSLVCTWVIYDIWFGSFIFSKKSEKSDSPVQNAIVNEGYLKTINNTSNSMPEKQLDIPFQTHKQDSVKRSEPIMNKNEHSEVINEDELYLQATQEVDEGNQDKALWAKCMALCEGDEGKAKYKYIKERVDRLRDEKLREIEERQREEILKNKTEEEIKEILIQNKIDFYLNPKNEEKLKVLLSRSKIYYEMYRGSYRVSLESNYVVHFKDIIKFRDFLKQKLPTLEGFSAN
jgi:hypothetical protein